MRSTEEVLKSVVLAVMRAQPRPEVSERLRRGLVEPRLRPAILDVMRMQPRWAIGAILRRALSDASAHGEPEPCEDCGEMCYAVRSAWKFPVGTRENPKEFMLMPKRYDDTDTATLCHLCRTVRHAHKTA